MRSDVNFQPVWHLSPLAFVRLAAGLALALVYVAPPRAQSTQPSSQPCAISGLVQAGTVPLPGAAIVALGADGAEISSTSSEQNGSYVLRLSGPGTYRIRATLAAFAPASREATLAAGDCTSRLDLTLVLASRAAAVSAAAPQTQASFDRLRAGPFDGLRAGPFDGLRAGPFDGLRAGRQGLGPRAFDGLRAWRVSAARRRHQRDRGTGSHRIQRRRDGDSAGRAAAASGILGGCADRNGCDGGHSGAIERRVALWRPRGPRRIRRGRT
jgi:hypothetical protein